MLVATQTFITSDAWHGEIRVKAGVTYVDPGSDLAKRFPDKFTVATNDPLGGRKKRSSVQRRTFGPGAASFRTSSSTVTAPHPTPLITGSSKPRWYLTEGRGPVPELRDSAGHFSVRLTAGARQDLLNLAAARPNVETGGLVMGARPRPWRSLVDCLLITAPGGAAEHLPRSYAPDRRADRETVAHARQQFGTELVVIGGWHTHPAEADDLPSEPDRRAMALARSRLGSALVVELIARPDPYRGWSRPVITPWIIRAAYHGAKHATVVERARWHPSCAS